MGFFYSNRLVMKLFRLLAIILITAIGASSSFSQSSDNVKYHFIIDISGSTFTIDKRHHLDSLLEQAINANIKNKKINEGNSFELIFFGKDTVARSVAFDLPSLHNLSSYERRAKIIVDSLVNNSSKRRFHKFSHLHAALDLVNVNVREASGIFIFTDGQILENDFSSDIATDVPQYVSILRKKIADLKAQGKPVFLVQVSQFKENPYFNLPKTPTNSQDSVVLGDDFFWVQRTLQHQRNARRPFEKFLAEAHERIIKSHQTAPIQKGDPIGTMVYVDRATTLTDTLSAHRISVSYSPSEADLIGKINSIESILSGASISAEQAIELKRQVDDLSTRAGELQALVKRLEYLSMRNKANPWVTGSLKRIQAEATHTDLSVLKSSPILSTDLEEAIVQGLADYIIKRSKQEAILFLMEEIVNKTNLSSTYVKDTLFYHSFHALKSMDQDNIINLLLIKEAFNQDLDNFPVNLIKHSKIKNSEALIGLVYAYQLSRNIMETGDLEESFVRLAELKLRIESLGPATSVLERGILLNAYLIGALKKYDLSHPLSLDRKQFKKLSVELVSYFGGLYPDFIKIDTTGIQTNVAHTYQKYLSIRSQINELAKLANQLPTGNYFEYQNYKRSILIDILQQSAELLISGVQLTYHFRREGDTSELLTTQIRKANDNAKRAIDAWFMIEDKKYTRAIMLLLPLIETIIQTNPDLTKYRQVTIDQLQRTMKDRSDQLRKQIVYFNTEAKDLKKHLRTLDSLGRLTPILDSLNRLTNKDAIKQGLSKYKLKPLEILIQNNHIDTATVSEARKFLENIRSESVKLKTLDLGYSIPAGFVFQFMDFPELNENLKRMVSIAADVSEVKQASDITNVMTKYALPPASYRIKREKKFAIMLNAYAGVGTSYFYRSDTASLILSAPLGLEFSSRGQNRKGSFSILFSPLDIGNVINYQLVGDKSADDGSVFKFANIYSPGIFVVFGLSKRHPFSLGLGHQWNDQRVSAFLAFDLPMFRIR